MCLFSLLLFRNSKTVFPVEYVCAYFCSFPVCLFFIFCFFGRLLSLPDVLWKKAKRKVLGRKMLRNMAFGEGKRHQAIPQIRIIPLHFGKLCEGVLKYFGMNLSSLWRFCASLFSLLWVWTGELQGRLTTRRRNIVSLSRCNYGVRYWQGGILVCKDIIFFFEITRLIEA